MTSRRNRPRSESHGVKNYQHQRQTFLLASEQRPKMRKSNVALSESFEIDRLRNRHASANDKRSKSSKAKNLSSSNRTSLSRSD